MNSLAVSQEQNNKTDYLGRKGNMVYEARDNYLLDDHDDNTNSQANQRSAATPQEFVAPVERTASEAGAPELFQVVAVAAASAVGAVANGGGSASGAAGGASAAGCLYKENDRVSLSQ